MEGTLLYLIGVMYMLEVEISKHNPFEILYT